MIRDNGVPVIEETKDATDLAIIYHLRAQIHSRSGKYLSEIVDGIWTDQYDETSLHFVARTGGRIVASARLTVVTRLSDGPFGGIYCEHTAAEVSPVGFLSRLVVAENYRARGIARELDEIRIDRARTLCAKTLVAATSNKERHLSFLRLGFQPISAELGCALSENVYGTLFMKSIDGR